MAGLRMSPSSPPVQHTSTVRIPAAWYFEIVPAPFDASSSGWACTVRMHNRSAMEATYLPDACTTPRPDLLGGEVATSAVPAPDDGAGDDADDCAGRQRHVQQVVSDHRAVEAAPGLGEAGQREQRDGHDGEHDGDDGEPDGDRDEHRQPDRALQVLFLARSD